MTTKFRKPRSRMIRNGDEVVVRDYALAWCYGRTGRVLSQRYTPSGYVATVSVGTSVVEVRVRYLHLV